MVAYWHKHYINRLKITWLQWGWDSIPSLKSTMDSQYMSLPTQAPPWCVVFKVMDPNSTFASVFSARRIDACILHKTLVTSKEWIFIHRRGLIDETLLKLLFARAWLKITHLWQGWDSNPKKLISYQIVPKNNLPQFSNASRSECNYRCQQQETDA